MNRRWVLASLSILLAGVLNPSALAGEPEWIEITSPHFSVVTDAGERRGREVATRFEQMRAVYATLMTNANVNIPVPLQIVAFRNTKELRQVSPLWNGKPVQLAGLFQGGKDRCFIMLDMSVDNPWNVVFHEYAHQLMNGTLTDEVDPWFEEGFAEYFSTIEVDSRQARVGKIPPRHLPDSAARRLNEDQRPAEGPTQLFHVQRKRRPAVGVLFGVVFGCSLPL